MIRPIFLAAATAAFSLSSTIASADSADVYAVMAHDAGRVVMAPIPPKRPKNLPTFIRGRLVCAANVNRLLHSKGVRGTGSNLALSFASWGQPSGIRPGAIQVERRRGGGHVRYVSHHDGQRWVCLNASARHQAWVTGPCSQGRAIAWRVAL